jgi:hypothetical protein
MAERRMFAKSIVMSDAFLDMPISARCLYFTLGMVADDDGFVGNPKMTVRMCGASMDDLNVLLAKRYVLGFKSGVIVVKHWKINNYLRNDRYSKTTYTEEKGTLTLDEKGSYVERNRVAIPSENNDGIPTVNHMVDERYTQDRIGKDRLGKVNICVPSNDGTLVDAETVDALPSEGNGHEKDVKITVPYREIIEKWNTTTAGRLPKVSKMTEARRTLIRQRWADYGEDVYKAIDKCIESDFLSGRNGKWDGCFFDWLFKAANMTKVLEGNYDNRPGQRVRKGNGNGFVPRDINGQYDDDVMEEVSEL